MSQLDEDMLVLANELVVAKERLDALEANGRDIDTRIARLSRRIDAMRHRSDMALLDREDAESKR